MLLRLKEDYDGAEPAAASVTVRNLLALGQLTGDGSLTRAGAAHARTLRPADRPRRARDAAHGRERGAVARAEDGDRPRRRARCSQPLRALERTLAREFLPWAVIVPVAPGPAQDALARTLPWLASDVAEEPARAAYVCHDFVCQAPTSDPAPLAQQLATKSEPSRIIRP